MASQTQSKFTISTSPTSESGSNTTTPLPKGQCLCSPTTHEGSFRCRLHRGSSSTTSTWIKRTKSMSNNNNKHVVFVSPNSTS
ncbi:unnamed protein product [Trifolium pratense]|uniref:Uncharacterized protein n=1 Tax=Trifolium pratense TaxID=57577 RepID=A0ACB0IZ05_TRIPR|nr:unnamed protein product [Trifolium pratense]